MIFNSTKNYFKNMKNILILDDHPIYREGLKSILLKYFNFNILEASIGRECLEILTKNKIDFITVDLNLPDIDGFELISIIKKNFSYIKILIITMYSSKLLIEKSKLYGVNGYIAKYEVSEKLITALKTIINGKNFFIEEDEEDEEEDRKNNYVNLKASRYFLLTPAEKEIFKLIAQSKNTKEIANILNKSYKTVANQKTSIFEKLNIDSEVELTKIALNLGII